MAFKFEISILGQQMKMDINYFLFIYFPIMDEFHPMINEIHPYEIIHLWTHSSM
jgi:hypothetical protein